MKTRAAVLWEVGKDWSVEDVELDSPHGGEVLLKMHACGLCHSDDHVRTGDMPLPHLPAIGGHEGAGEVIEVGPGVTSVAVGDHVALSFVPSCGVCPECQRGAAFLCDEGARLFEVGMISDGRHAHLIKGEPASRFAQVGAFSEHQLLHEHSVVKVDPDIPWHAVALVSCGVATGVGAVVNRAEVRPGDTVVVVGTGGIGISAVQGAKIAGAKAIIAVDLLASRRDQALSLGATHAFASMDEARAGLADLTLGRMADAVILSPGVMSGDLLAPALALTKKDGTCVVTGIGKAMERTADVSLFTLAMMNQQIKGTIYGSGSPRVEIPRLLDLYRAGVLKLDEMVTQTYSLDDINVGYADMHSGANIRGVITF